MRWVTEGFRRGFDFHGRSSRSAFWTWALFVTAGGVGALVTDEWLGLVPHGDEPFGPNVGGVFSGLFALATAVPSVAVAARRLHDSDRRGWWLLLPVALPTGLLALLFISIAAGAGGLPLAILFVLSPVLGGFALLPLLCLSGTRGPNRFGPDPKDPASTADLAEVFR